MKEQNVVTNEQAREAIDRILNFCEEIDNHIPTDEKTGYKMLPDYFIVSRYLNEECYRKQEWISVDDRLPEECKNVLCFEGNKIVIAFMEKTEDCGEYVPVFWDWVAYDRDDTYDEVCATHWMPLPQPPKMKGGEADA